MIQINQLSFTYAGTHAPLLHDLSWEIDDGAFCLLTGSTGSGKSTLLSLIKPEIAPRGMREGSILVAGRETAQLSVEESARLIGYVAQSPENQIVCERVWHELAFGLENLGTPPDEMRRRVAEVSYLFGMESWIRSETASLSGGRKQLVALASALALQPSVLLLDEPTAQLDPIAEKNFLHALFRINRELGCTVVVATHRPAPMVDYATCAWELKSGRVRKIEDLEVLRRRESLLEASGRSVSGAGAGAFAVARNVRASGERASADGGSMSADVPSRQRSNRAPTGVQACIRDESSHAVRGAGQVGSYAVEVRDVWFRYERLAPWVLRGLCLIVEAGDVPARLGCIHAVVGGNGCGKSTLLAIMAGVHRLRRGSVRRGSRACALLPQDPRALFAKDTALSELMEWSDQAGYSEHDAKVILAQLGLSASHKVHPLDLSGGQRQLLALGKLLLLHPKLLLLDEPTKGLDLASRRLIAGALKRATAEGASVILATHDLDFVSQVADVVSMMFDGEIASTSLGEEFFRTNVYYRP
ncbi:ATP-binding cassette domain-containing protein [Collinsella sp. AGMB00827]|uniref:ATP-binding cassette domain-containing protein n=1 Tax=Collinsella ureilytica TaxID=2869515 RepID=A0ABS7MKY6_9ACTN|nr:ABC transporter ATP-binding protein [Collinsella urealyticum]MBY4797736.1 ATP-binding cassette domain-containing protein [Collinsella urealyticum]